MNRIKKLVAFFAFSLLVLGLPTLASAQWRDRDNEDDDGYYKRDKRDKRDKRNDNDDDDGYYRNDRNQNGNYNRNLNATIKNLKNRSKEFARRLDRELDKGRYNNRNREDRLLGLAEDFKDAAKRLDDRYDNSRDYNNSSNEARRVLQLGQQLESALYSSRLNNNVQSDWNRIRQDLNVLANAYGYNNRNTRTNRNGSWRDKLPFPLPF